MKKLVKVDFHEWIRDLRIGQRDLEFIYRGRHYLWCSFAEGCGQEIIGHIIYDIEKKDHIIWIDHYKKPLTKRSIQIYQTITNN